jgi:adenosylcobinamide kinase/adenosylcobinamide-phosphate guanylyltransferase
MRSIPGSPSPMPCPITLVTGPSRSGKSRWAEHLAHCSQLPVIYVATSHPAPDDPEWQNRIRHHQQRRPAHWRTLEPPLDLVALCHNPPPDTCLLVDSLGTWVAEFLALNPSEWLTLETQLLTALKTISTPIILVAEEVGWGVVPAYPSGRSFRDRLGELVQAIGAIADQVYLVTGGWAINLTELGQPVPRGAFPDSVPPA